MDDQPLIKRLATIATDAFIEGMEPAKRDKQEPPPGAPAPGSDVGAWLDWREREKRRGTWYRLSQVAIWSGFSHSKVKHESSARKPRGTPKKTKASDKKVQ